MRNLKKILALVLALIMSLSLMATANAKTDFKDDESIDTYQTAIEVLSGLKVFGGDQNGNFNPKDPIRRSEVAAIIYRIATGDVTNDHSASYGLYNQFKDVQDGDWFAGYVSYCHNAGYIKGHGDSTFAPYDNVTGYQALAMILRAVGYDKNNEFTGDNWQINTASIATQRGVLSGLKSTEDLKAPASRELVAEILFQSILLDKVQWNALTHSYDTTNEKVCDVLSLEEISGTVMANEWANINVDSSDRTVGTRPIASGKTEMATDKGVKTLDWTTNLTDLGETRNAYIQKGKVLYMEDGGDTLYENNGERNDISTAAKFKSVTGVSYNSDTQWFKNFGPSTKVTSDYRIEFSVSFRSSTANTAKNGYEYFGWTDAQLTDAGMTKDTTVYKETAKNGEYYITYTKVIPAGEEISANDQAIMEDIFARADHDPIVTTNNSTITLSNHPTNGVCGYVFTGTNSNSSINRNIDRSDEMSYTKFEEEYLNPGNKVNISKAENGEWLKVIDNDADGVADYVLLTESHLDQVNRVINKKDETTSFQYYNVDTTKGIRYLKDGEMVDSLDLAQNTKVLWSLIDGYYYMELADVQTGSVKKVNYGTAGVEDEFYLDSVDTVEEVNYKQSGIDNETRLEKWLRNASRDVEYYFYADHFGTIRAYEPVNGTQYALLTEAYSRNTDNGRYLKNWVGTVEHKIGDAPIANATVDNFNGNYEEGNIFFNKDYSVPVGNNLYDILQPATANLDTRIAENVFGWNGYCSDTNVAAYTKGSDGTITINSAAQQATNDNGDYLYRQSDGTIGTAVTANPLWASNYVKLDAGKDIKKAMYTMDSGLYGASQYLHATPDTEYYVVYGDNQTIRYYVGYSAFPGFDAKYIERAYAVAHNDYGTSASDLRDYWVADVVVLELNSSYNAAYDDVVLVTYNQDKWRASDSMYTLYGISAKTGEEVTFQINRNEWTNWMTNNLPFFVGTRTVSSEGDMEVRTINGPFYYTDAAGNRAPSALDFSANGINVGRINVIPGAKDGGIASYVNVLRNGDGAQEQLNLPNVYTVSNNSRDNIKDYYITRDYVYNTGLKTYGNEGDLILWVNKPGTTTPSFVVMVTTRNENTGAYYWTWDGKACDTKTELDSNGNPSITAAAVHDSLSGLWDDVRSDAKNVASVGTAAPTISLVVDGKTIKSVKADENTLTIPYAAWRELKNKDAVYTVKAADGNTITSLSLDGKGNNLTSVTGKVGTNGTIVVTSKGDSNAKALTYTVNVVYTGKNDTTDIKLVTVDTTNWKAVNTNGKIERADGKTNALTLREVMMDFAAKKEAAIVNGTKIEWTFSTESDSNIWRATTEYNMDGTVSYVAGVDKFGAAVSLDTITTATASKITAVIVDQDNYAVGNIYSTEAASYTLPSTSVGTNSIPNVSAVEDSKVAVDANESGTGYTAKTSLALDEEKSTETVEVNGNKVTTEVEWTIVPADDADGVSVKDNGDGTFDVEIPMENASTTINAGNSVAMESKPMNPETVGIEAAATGKILDENGDLTDEEVELKNVQVVLEKDASGKAVPKYYTAEVDEEPSLDDSNYQAGVRVFKNENGTLVQVRAAFGITWIIKVPVNNKTIQAGIVVEVEEETGKVEVNLSFIGGAAAENQKALLEARETAKGAVDSFVNSYCMNNNAFADNQWIKMDGILKTTENASVLADAYYPQVAITETALLDATLLNKHSLNEGIQYIKDMIDAAKTVRDVQRIFWNEDGADATSGWTCMGYDVTGNATKPGGWTGTDAEWNAQVALNKELCEYFGYSGQLKDGLANMCQIIGVAQNAINDVNKDAATKTAILALEPPTGEMTGVTVTSDNRETVRLAQAIQNITNAAVPAAKRIAKGYVTDFISNYAALAAKNAYSNEWINESGEIASEGNFYFAGADLSASDITAATTSVIGCVPLAKAAEEIGKLIDAKTTLSTVKNVFYKSADGHGEYGCSSWGWEIGTEYEVGNVNFGVSSNLIQYIMNEAFLNAYAKDLNVDLSDVTVTLPTLNEGGVSKENIDTYTMAAAIKAIQAGVDAEETPAP